MSKKKKKKKSIIRADTKKIKKPGKKKKNKKKKSQLPAYQVAAVDPEEFNPDYVSEYGLHTYQLPNTGGSGETRAAGTNVTDLIDSGSVLLQALLGKNVVTREMALQVPTVRACIDKIASTISSVPICLYRRDGDGKPEKITDDRRLFLLNHDTGDTLQSTQFLRALLEDYFLGQYGGYAYINRAGTEFHSLNYVPAREIAVTDNNNPIFKDFNIWIRGKTYFPYEFLRVMRGTVDGIRNKTLIDDNPLLVSLCYASLQYEDSLVRKGGNKKGFLLAERNLTREAQEDLKTNFRNLYSNNSENVVVLNNGLKFQESSNTSVELQLNENKESNAKEICKIFGVPPTILYGGATDKDWEIFIHSCMSIIFDIEKSLDRDLLAEEEKGKLFFQFDTNELTRGNIKERYEAYQTALKNSFLRIDEVREKEGLQPIGFNFVQLGLDSVLYDPEKGTVYTPNTNALTQMDSGVSLIGDKTEPAKTPPEDRAYKGKNILITGAPSSGKTTFARENMSKDDILVDLDAIKAALLGNRQDSDFHSQISDDKVELLRLVQKVLKDAVHNGVTENKTWFLTTETDGKKLQEWCNYCNAKLKIMDTDKETCKKRVAKDDSRQNKELFYKLINNWFREMKEGEKK